MLSTYSSYVAFYKKVCNTVSLDEPPIPKICLREFH